MLLLKSDGANVFTIKEVEINSNFLQSDQHNEEMLWGKLHACHVTCINAMVAFAHKVVHYKDNAHMHLALITFNCFTIINYSTVYEASAYSITNFLG